jgi:hypothetical protein
MTDEGQYLKVENARIRAAVWMTARRLRDYDDSARMIRAEIRALAQTSAGWHCRIRRSRQFKIQS